MPQRRRRRLLDLFTGGGSVRKAAEALGYEVRTLDIEKKSNATYTSDILKFDYKAVFADWVPDLIWASPSCTEYSTAKTGIIMSDKHHLLHHQPYDRNFAIFNGSINPLINYIVQSPFGLHWDHRVGCLY